MSTHATNHHNTPSSNNAPYRSGSHSNTRNTHHTNNTNHQNAAQRNSTNHKGQHNHYHQNHPRGGPLIHHGEMRAWFDQLSREERMAALAFQDSPLIHALATLAEAAEEKSPHLGGWNDVVSLKQVYAEYEKLGGVPENHRSNNTSSSNRPTKQQPYQSPRHPPDSSDDIQKIQTLMKKILLTFPAVWKQLDQSNHHSTPKGIVATLEWPRRDSDDGEGNDLFLHLLDAICTKTMKRSFMAITKRWPAVLKEMADKKMPIFAVLLLRMETHATEVFIAKRFHNKQLETTTSTSTNNSKASASETYPPKPQTVTTSRIQWLFSQKNRFVPKEQQQQSGNFCNAVRSRDPKASLILLPFAVILKLQQNSFYEERIRPSLFFERIDGKVSKGMIEIANFGKGGTSNVPLTTTATAASQQQQPLQEAMRGVESHLNGVDNSKKKKKKKTKKKSKSKSMDWISVESVASEQAERDSKTFASGKGSTVESLPQPNILRATDRRNLSTVVKNIAKDGDIIAEPVPKAVAVVNEEFQVSAKSDDSLISPPIKNKTEELVRNAAVDESRAENGPSSQSTSEEAKSESVGDDNEWETVGTRSRGRKKQNNDQNNGGNSNNNGSPRKEKKKASQSKRKNASRKIAREILHSVLDGVEEHVRSNPRTLSKNSDGADGGESSTTITASNEQSKSQKGSSPSSTNQLSELFTFEVQQKKASPADQSTAPTYQETVSAVSATSNTVAETKKETAQAIPSIHPTPPSSQSRGGYFASTEVLPQVVGDHGAHTPMYYQQQHHPSDVTKQFPPPLPTLLSAENANSATSSVASSLEAPHILHHHNGHHQPMDDNAVGYHLLSVCNRLNKDISLFMKSMTQALSIRRNERSIILSALQETVSGIWPNACRVEMYGSCATMLDLPSSDLDVVILGLGQSEMGWNSGVGGENSPSNDSQPHYMPVYSPNAHRVMKLSAAIEKLPWAVQVKSLPNATVPVIKILADPSKISGSTSPDWIGFDGETSSEDGAGAPRTDNTSGGQAAEASSSNTPQPHSPSPQPQLPYHQPWRGSDLQNDLISLDITFEGPEHGGIGSTEYSLHVVNQACQETGLIPQETPLVQCLMVLKELLAQRKLNEPYSGGLSSYALLLLLTALLRERAAIRAEIERSQQRQQSVMVSPDSIPMSPLTPDVFESAPINPQPTFAEQVRSKQQKQSQPMGNVRSKANVVDGAEGNGVASAKAKTEPLKEENKVTPALTSKKGDTAEAKAASKKGEGAKKTTTANKKDESEAKSVGAKTKSAAPSTASETTGSKVPAVAKPPASSWASIARKTESGLAQSKKSNGKQAEGAKKEPEVKKPEAKKPLSFADAVGKSSISKDTAPKINPKTNIAKSAQSGTPAPAVKNSHIDPAQSKKKNGFESQAGCNSSSQKQKPSSHEEPADQKVNKEETPVPSNPVQQQPNAQYGSAETPVYSASEQQPNASPMGRNPPLHGMHTPPDPRLVPTFFPQGFDDVIEVLCLGETTAGKLLMHFLLHYGQYFDAGSTAIDISGKHERHITIPTPYSCLTPYIGRSQQGTIDPHTGMLMVENIVIYDPLEGAEKHNVARRCFAWDQVRWIFMQSYTTLSSAVEKVATQTGSKESAKSEGMHQNQTRTEHNPGEDLSWDISDPSSPLLRCLLSF